MKQIWCLFSIANEYDQPSNNLEAWWAEKPSIEELAKVIELPIDAKIVEKCYEGWETNAGWKLFRLEQVEEGKIN